MPKGPENMDWKPSKEQKDTATAYGLLKKLREEAAVKSMEKDADQRVRENALRIWDRKLKGQSRRRSKKTRRTRRH